jgi:hypothetical protein
VELEIEFVSSGYIDPGSIAGPPEKCYPPEGDEERTIVGMRLCGENVHPKIVEALRAYIEDAVYDADIEDTIDDHLRSQEEIEAERAGPG